MKTIKKITIPPCSGKETIAEAKDVFTGWIDSDFKNWKADEEGSATPETQVTLSKLTENSTFEQIFSTPDSKTLTQSQIISFIRNNTDLFQGCYNPIFFLFKSHDEFFVACADLGGDGQRWVFVRRLDDGGVWFAKFASRFVLPAALPQLTPNLSETESLTPSHLETLENRVKKLEGVLEEVRNLLNL